MTFVYPAFLTALAVLLIPIVIHLFRFRKYKTIYFTRVSFLRSAELETKNQSRLKHLLTLAARMLAFTMLVLAFAIPSCRKNPNAGSGKSAVSVYIDNSFSMGAGSDGIILLETAKNKAREIIKSYGDAAVFQVLSNNPRGQQLDFSSGADALRFIDELAISPAPAALSDVVKRMREYLSVRPETTRGYVISDFQKTFCGSFTGGSSGAPVTFIRLKREVSANISLDSAWTEQAFIVPGEKNRLMVKVKNFTNESITDFPVKLTSGGNLLGIGKISVEKQSEAVAGIEFTPGTQSFQAAELSIEESGAVFDNNLYLDLSPGSLRKIYLTRPNRFVEAVVSSQMFLKSVIQTPEISKKGSSAEVWLDPSFGDLTREGVQAMIDWASLGGTVILAPAEGKGSEAMMQRFGLAKAEWMPGKYKISQGSFSHPFFKRIFREVPANMDLPMINRYFSTAGQTGSGEALLSLENGDPLLLSFSSGNGRIYLFTSPLTAEAGNLVKSSLFLPVLTNALVSADRSMPIYGVAGSSQLLALRPDLKTSEAMTLKNSKVQLVPEITGSATGPALFLGQEPSVAGNYELMPGNGGQVQQMLAINYSRVESNPAVAENEDLTEASVKNGFDWLNEDKTSASFGKVISDFSDWKVFIWLAALFFLLEVLIITFWDKLLLKPRTA